MKRGWIILANGERYEVPLWTLDHEHITWPPTMHEKQPGEPVHYSTRDDSYRRHEVVPGELFVFLRDSSAHAEVPPDILEWVKRQAEGSSQSD